MITRDTTMALRRFGLGTRPGEMPRIAADPRGFVLSALADPRAALIEDASLDPSHVTFAAALHARQRQRAARKAVERAADAGVAAQAPTAALAPAAAPPHRTEAQPAGRIRHLGNQLVSASEQRLRDRETQCLGGFAMGTVSARRFSGFADGVSG